MPRSAATCIGAVVSVCWVRTSTPWSISALAASASLPGSNQVFAQTTLILKSGLIDAGAGDEGVDAHHHFRDREGGDVAGDALLRHLRSDLALDVAAFIEAAVVGRKIRCGLVAGGMLELHVRELRGDLDRRVHEAEGRGEDQAAAGAGQALDGALGIRAFRNVFEELRLDLVAERLFEFEAADVMRLRPAAIGLGTDIDEADLCLFLVRLPRRKSRERQRWLRVRRVFFSL